VRCRPFSEKEKKEGHSNIVHCDQEAASVIIKNPQTASETKSFTFDYAFGEESMQLDVYNKTARSIVDAVLEGYNGTIFAYGIFFCF
jgi:hypothetical protein